MNIQPVESASFNIGGWVLTAVATSAEGTDYVGFFTSPAIGSIAPTTFLGNTITTLGTHNLTGFTTYNTGLIITGNLAQNVFTSITCNSTTLTPAGASVYTFLGGTTLWQWDTIRLLSAAGTYSVTITI